MDESTDTEGAVIGRLVRILGMEAPTGEVWIGDDAAVLAAGSSVACDLLFAADILIEGVHFDLSFGGLDDAGFKAIQVNVSDIAAMGGMPTAAVVSVGVPPDGDVDILYRGIAEAARDCGCPVVGGDLSQAAEWVLSVAVLGSVPRGTAVLRSGARPGDAVFVSGALGAGAAALARLRSGASDPAAAAYLRPVSQVPEGVAAREAGATSMIDVSDGFALDLHRVADASGVGFAIDEVPVAVGASLDDAVGGGEDYELVFTAPEADAVFATFATCGLRTPLLVGSVVDDPAVRTLGGRALEPRGWEHRVR